MSDNVRCVSVSVSCDRMLRDVIVDVRERNS